MPRSVKFALVLAGIGIAGALVAGVVGWSSLASGSASGPQLSAAGLTLELLQGWTGKIGRLLTIDGSPGPTKLAAASFALPEGDDDFGTEAIKRMSPADARIVMLEYDPPPHPSGWAGQFPALEGPLGIRAGDFTSFEGIPSEHAFARRTFSVTGRYFDVWVDFATPEARDRLLGDVNASLGTLLVARDPGRSG